MTPNSPYILATLSSADDEHLDEYIAHEIFNLHTADDVLAYSQTLLDAIEAAQMIMVTIPCGFEMSTHPDAVKEAWFSYKGTTVYASADTLPLAIRTAGLVFFSLPDHFSPSDYQSLCHVILGLFPNKTRLQHDRGERHGSILQGVFSEFRLPTFLPLWQESFS